MYILNQHFLFGLKYYTLNLIFWSSSSFNNVVIFARGYFVKDWQDLSHGDNFHDISPISLIKSYGFYFPAGEIFSKMVISRKKRKLPQPNIFTFTVCCQCKWSQYTLMSFVASPLQQDLQQNLCNYIHCPYENAIYVTYRAIIGDI